MAHRNALEGVTPGFALAIYRALQKITQGLAATLDLQQQTGACHLGVAVGEASSAAAVPGPEVQLGRLAPTHMHIDGKDGAINCR